MTNTNLPISVRKLAVSYGGTDVLKGVSLDVARGESVAILGSNGSGKSTLVKAILGIAPASAGSVELFGNSLRRRANIPWDRIGYVPQRVTASSGVPSTALEVVRSGLLGSRRLWADRGRKAKARALEALDAVGLADRANDHVQVFSGGQAQRVLIARALVRQPELFILDEPLAGIDRDSREGLADILQGLMNEGTTLVTVLHEMGELSTLIRRAVVVDEGRIIHDGEPPAPEPGHEHPGHEHVHPHADPNPPAHHAPELKLETK